MLAKLNAIVADFEQLEASLASPEVLGDQRKLRDASRRYKQMGPLIECIRRYRATTGDVEVTGSNTLEKLYGLALETIHYRLAVGVTTRASPTETDADRQVE